MKRTPWWCWIIGSCLLLAALPAKAQSVGGSTTIAANTGSQRVAFPASVTQYPVAVISPANGSATDIFYALGGSTVTATVAPAGASNGVVPIGGICLNIGPNTYIAAITATSSATLWITQYAQCPILGHLHAPSSSPPPACSNKFDFSQPCNSQYLGFM